MRGFASALTKAATPKADDPNVSWGPIELTGVSGPSREQREVWQIVSGATAAPTLTSKDREVARVLEIAQAGPHLSTRSVRLYARIHWTDPGAAASRDLRLEGRPVRMLDGG